MIPNKSERLRTSRNDKIEKEGLQMSLKSLAEMIILQSIEDLFSVHHKKESIHFFTGEGFGIFSEIAGIGIAERRNLVDMFNIFLEKKQTRHSKKKVAAGGGV